MSMPEDIQISAEEEKIYRKVERAYTMQDIRHKCLERILGIEEIDDEIYLSEWEDEVPPENELTTDETRKLRKIFNNPGCIVDLALDNIGDCDGMFEYYWYAIDGAIDEELKG